MAIVPVSLHSSINNIPNFVSTTDPIKIKVLNFLQPEEQAILLSTCKTFKVLADSKDKTLPVDPKDQVRARFAQLKIEKECIEYPLSLRILSEGVDDVNGEIIPINTQYVVFFDNQNQDFIIFDREKRTLTPFQLKQPNFFLDAEILRGQNEDDPLVVLGPVTNQGEISIHLFNKNDLVDQLKSEPDAPQKTDLMQQLDISIVHGECQSAKLKIIACFGTSSQLKVITDEGRFYYFVNGKCINRGHLFNIKLLSDKYPTYKEIQQVSDVDDSCIFLLDSKTVNQRMLVKYNMTTNEVEVLADSIDHQSNVFMSKGSVYISNLNEIIYLCNGIKKTLTLSQFDIAPKKICEMGETRHGIAVRYTFEMFRRRIFDFGVKNAPEFIKRQISGIIIWDPISNKCIMDQWKDNNDKVLKFINDFVIITDSLHHLAMLHIPSGVWSHRIAQNMDASADHMGNLKYVLKDCCFLPGTSSNEILVKLKKGQSIDQQKIFRTQIIFRIERGPAHQRENVLRMMTFREIGPNIERMLKEATVQRKNTSLPAKIGQSVIVAKPLGLQPQLINGNALPGTLTAPAIQASIQPQSINGNIQPLQSPVPATQGVAMPILHNIPVNAVGQRRSLCGRVSAFISGICSAFSSLIGKIKRIFNCC